MIRFSTTEAVQALARYNRPAVVSLDGKARRQFDHVRALHSRLLQALKPIDCGLAWSDVKLLDKLLLCWAAAGKARRRATSLTA